jgi:hypothetical protein
MKYLFMLGVVLLGFAAYPSTDAVACEACLSDGKPEPNESSICFEAPDGPGEICTVGGGYCNEEGTCDPEIERIAADGSMRTPAEDGATPLVRFASADDPATSGGADTDDIVRRLRRQCDQAIVARWYAPGQAERLRRETSSLTI